MKYATEIIAIFVFLTAGAAQADSMRESVLRTRAMETGLVRTEAVLPPISEPKSNAGRLLFESTELSLNRQTSCQTCHLDRFSSADGIPNAIGTGGDGEGIVRAEGEGDIVPRNTLPLWGRGSIGFDRFFWDGKVDGTIEPVHSQFGDTPPSNDPLTVAVHLPIVEIREMISDAREADELRTETVSSAARVFEQIESRVREHDGLSTALNAAYEISSSDISIIHITDAIAQFVRDRFRLHDTKFHEFVFEQIPLEPEELAGGLLFYGKGRCSACHNGPFFSDLEFHAIPFGQAGFGKNGFGVDYGRYNVTLNAEDIYKFRTPPLFNVTLTAPYSHSGNTYDLADAIRAHTDPLSVVSLEDLSAVGRVEFYKRLRAWSSDGNFEVALDQAEIDALAAFLGTLEFEDAEAPISSPN